MTSWNLEISVRKVNEEYTILFYRNEACKTIKARTESLKFAMQGSCFIKAYNVCIFELLYFF